MLPLFKVFSLLIKIFSRPLVNYSKKIHMDRKQHSHRYLRLFFITLGNKYHIYETKINRKFLNIDSDTANFRIKNLNDNDALNKGVEFFYEIILYSILIFLPLYEMNKSSNESKEKAVAQNKKMGDIETNLDNLKTKITEESSKITEKLGSFKQYAEEISKDIEKQSLISHKNAEDLKNDIAEMLKNTQTMTYEVHESRENLYSKLSSK